ncbi:hypothetical protein ACFQVC_32815 [Streptomyces monticola]|uniref:Uncharacterized protein n=1 Tax=Streptomyces monticola TaxID=2666263 RepID=A0ABW2JTK7_9ACTN
MLDRLKFPLSLALADYQSCSLRDDGRLTAVGLWTTDGATARTSGEVRQCGPRRLWDTVENLARIFPGKALAREDFGLSVSPHGQRIWYGDQSETLWTLVEPSRLTAAT